MSSARLSPANGAAAPVGGNPAGNPAGNPGVERGAEAAPPRNITVEQALRMRVAQRGAGAEPGGAGRPAAAGGEAARPASPGDQAEGGSDAAALLDPLDPSLFPVEPAAAAEGPAPAGAADMAATVTVMADGQPQTLTVAELARGFLREADYTRKTQALAAERQQLAQRQAEVAALEARIGHALPRAVEAGDAEFGQPIDWAALSVSDPIGFTEKFGRFLAWQQAQAGQAQAEARRQAIADAMRERAVAQGYEQLAARYPVFADEHKRRIVQEQLAAHAREVGYQDHELAQAADPRAMVLAYESMMFRRLVAARPWASEAGGDPGMAAAPPARRYGAAASPAAGGAVSEAAQAFEARPTVGNAVQLLRARRAGANRQVPRL